MKHPLALALALALAAMTTSCAHSVQAESAVTTQNENPLFVESTLALKYPHFDQIKDTHFAPAIERGMAEQIAEVNAIADAKRPPPNFMETLCGSANSPAKLYGEGA